MLLSLCAPLAAMAAVVGTAYSSPHGNVDRADSTSSPAVITACNNSPDLCNRTYNNITHMGAHDSSFLRDESTSNSLAGNQFYNATAALDAGIRLLQVQVHNHKGTIEMCHTMCSLLDAGPLQDWLSKVSVWMDENPNEVVTLVIVNSDGFDVAQFGSVFKASGIAKYGYTPSGNGWPTLKSMIKNKKRLVTLIASIDHSSAYPYLLSEFNYVFETSFEVTSPSGFNCAIDRPKSQGSASSALSTGLLPLVNHFAYKDLGSGITIPDVDNINRTNDPSEGGLNGSLGRHLQTCHAQWNNVKPAFVLVDFWDMGPAIKAADTINGVTNPVGRKNPASNTDDNNNNTNDPQHDGSDSKGGRKIASMGTGAVVAFIAAALVLA
ncbi:PLC-like phosphodiesterase [Poronia punctata]|nr:PLC-like phosphodiesterase [Poronia punctata]